MSSRIGGFILSLTVTLLLLVLICFVWYHILGWQHFTFSTGDSVSWTPSGSKTIDYIRFKNCSFIVTPPSGTAKTIDVTKNLNNMAKAYTASPISGVKALTLVRNLNPMSFTITGLNDSLANAQAAKIISPSPVSCTTDADCPYSKNAGACGPPNNGTSFCVNGPTSLGVTVQLTGYWKTL
jgi:hypothetical protein